MIIRSIVLVLVLLATSAYGVSPTIEHFSGGCGDPPGTGQNEDVLCTLKSVSVPRGTAVMIWSVFSVTEGVSARPAIGLMTGRGGSTSQSNGQESFSGTWVTPVEAGTYDVRMQVQTCVSCGINSNGYSWTLIVFPDEQATVPAVGNIGLGILIATILAGGGWIIGRRTGMEVAAGG